MAATVTWEGLRDLATFRAENGCAISLYLDLDPSVSPTAGAVDSRVNALLDEIVRSEAANRAELTHEQKQGLGDDVARLRAFFESDFSRERSHGYAVYSAGLDNVWQPLPLSERVPDLIKVGRTFYLAPLVPLIGRGDGVLVAFVGRERGNLYRLRGGRLEELANEFDEQHGRHDQGGWSQARYQRHIETLVHEHLKEVAEQLDRRVRRLQSPRIVVLTTEETRAELEEVLSHEVKNAIVGWTQAEAHAAPAELLQAARPILEEWHAKQEKEAAERWREESGRGSRATAGWHATLEAASDGRVELLLFHEGAEHSAWQCRRCGRVSAEGGPCPLDGTQMEERDDGLNLAVHQTLAHGGSVLALRHYQDLDPVEGIGALLRY